MPTTRALVHKIAYDCHDNMDMRAHIYTVKPKANGVDTVHVCPCAYRLCCALNTGSNNFDAKHSLVGR